MQGPTTKGAQEALRGLALAVRSSEKAPPKGGLEGFLEAAWSRRGAAAALMGVSMLGGAVNQVAQQPALRQQAQDLFERTAKPASAWLQDQASAAIERTGLSPLATLLAQKTKGAPEQVSSTRQAEASTPAQLLDAIESGRLTLDVPLRAGEVSIKGVTARIEPGTVVHVQVDIEDGKLVPRSDGEGTFATLNKPIDGPLFVNVNGAELVDAGGGRGALEVKLGSDWGSLFDLGVAKQPLRLSELIGSFEGQGAAAGDTSTTTARGGLRMEDIVDTGAVRFSVDGLTLADGVLPATGLSLTQTSGALRMEGDASSLTVSGDVGFDSFRLERPEGAIRFTDGSARVAVSARKDGAGAVITTTVTGLKASIDAISLPGDAGPGGGSGANALTLDAGTVRGGDITVVARTGGGGAAQVDVRADLEVTGRFQDSQLRIADDDGGASVRAHSGELSGQVKIRGAAVEVNATLTNADLSLSSLQRRGERSSVDLETVRLRGDGHLQTTPVQGLSLRLANADVDAVISDMRSQGASVDTDLGRTTVAGKGDLTWSRAGGLHIEGDLRVNGQFDDLQVRSSLNGSVLDLAPSSTVDGRLRRLSVGGEGFALELMTNVDLKLESSRLDAGAVALEGGGRIVGAASLRIEESARGSRLRLEGDTRIDLDVRDGRVSRGDDLDADLGVGTRVSARLRSLQVGDGVTLSLGSGSRMDAVLDGGSVRLGDRLTPIAAGTRATFEIDRLHVGPDGQPELEGKLSVALPFDAELMKDLPGVSLLSTGNGIAHLTIGGVRMGADGSFSLSDVDIGLEARTGTVTAATAHRAAAPASLEGPVEGVLSRDAVGETSAAGIVGVAQSERARFNPMAVARRIQSGSLEISVPMEGRVKKGAVGVRFREGTELRLKVQVANGRIVPGELEARLSQPADGPLWVTVKGVRMSDSGTLKLDLGGFFDIAIPGMHNMPTDVEGFVGRLEHMSQGRGDAQPGASETRSASTNNEASLFSFDQARFRIQDATLAPGVLALPGGSVNLEAGTRLSLTGNMTEGEAEAQVAFSELSLDEGAFAVRGGGGTAMVRTAYKSEGGQLRSRTTVEDLILDVASAAHVGEGGEYLHLERGRVGGKVTLEHSVSLDAAGRPLDAGIPTVDLDLDVEGTLKGARLAAPDSDDGAHVEVGNTSFTGDVHVAGSRLESVKGRVLGLDASVTGLDLGTPAGLIAVERARVAGDGHVELTPERIAVLDGSLIADVVVNPAKVGMLELAGADVDVSRAKLSLRLDLSRLNRLELATGADVPVGERLKLDAELGLGAAVREVSGVLVHR